ncbi:hypothetical protein SNA_25555 [Streptomyces natalensis ATCC 27448]|uniref:CRISPR-associated protein Cse3 n=1 Tax=Streptomyces natalensis ATCC 27448 TaxID=1240678 RepID=A0A0D7CHP0_9ACTN|nr:hypothetical protein SNA_25555 [Streptomyces natalensis ATCC 27448]
MGPNTAATSAWLTQIVPNYDSYWVQCDLTTGDGLHKRLMKLDEQPAGTPHARQSAGLLYRLDDTPTGPLILAQTWHRPDLTALPDDYGQAETRDMTAFLNHLQQGQQVRYRITANPVRSRSLRVRRDIQTTHGLRELPPDRVPLAGADADQWWTNRAEQAGLAIHNLSQTTPPAILMKAQRGQRRYRHTLLTFTGYATITNLYATRDAITTGIGRARAYGAGLLSLAPA